MTSSPMSIAKRLVRLAVTLTPSLLAMYTFYWLDTSGTWTTDTPHRGKMSVALLTAGLVLSFVVYSRLARGQRSG